MIDARIRLTTDDVGIARIAIVHPEKRNAVAPSMWDALAQCFSAVSADPKVRVVILSGDGEHFCSGSDVDKIETEFDIADGIVRLRRANQMIRAIYTCEKPVIAAVLGAAAGVGWSLALACDFIVAADNARFGGGFTRIGLVPDGGSLFFLSRLLGEAKAKELTYTGRFVSAAEAVELGMAIRLVPVDQFDTDVTKFAQTLAQGPTTTIALTKRMFRVATGSSLEQYFEQEELAQVCAKETDDFVEGMAAFQERRPASFTGR